MTIGWRCPRCGDRDAETLALYRDHDDARPAAHYRRVGPWCITCGSRAQFDLPAEERRTIGARNPSARVLVLSGTCASGKSTIANLLAERYRLVPIDGDWLLSYYKNELGRPIPSDRLNDDLLSIAAGLAALGMSSVIAHVVLPASFPAYDAYLTACGLPHRIVALTPGMPVLRARNRTRTCWPKPTPERWIVAFADALLDAPGVAGSVYHDNARETEDETAKRLWQLLCSA